MSDDGRILPHSAELEAGVLSAMITRPEKIHPILDELRAVGDTAFYRDAHRTIYRAITDIVSAGGTPAYTSVRDRIERSGTDAEALDMARGALIELSRSDLIGSIPAAVEDAARLRDYATRRSALVLLDRASKRVEDTSDGDVYGTVEDAAGLLSDLALRRSTAEPWRTAGDVGAEALERLKSGQQARRVIPVGIPTIAPGAARSALDVRLGGGLTTGRLWVLVGSPGHGKTSLAIQMAYNAAATGARVGYLWLEDGTETFAEMAIQQRANLPSDWQTTYADLSPAARRRAEREVKRLQELPLRVETLFAPTVDEVVHSIRRLKQMHGVDLVVVDLLGRITYRGNRQSYQEEYSQIVSILAGCATREDIALLVLHHLNTEYERGQDEGDEEPRYSRPRPENIAKTAGALQFAYGILALHNPTARSDPERGALRDGTGRVWRDAHGIARAEIGSLKIKNQRAGWWLPVRWNGARRRFDPLPENGEQARDVTEPADGDDEEITV